MTEGRKDLVGCTPPYGGWGGERPRMAINFYRRATSKKWQVLRGGYDPGG